MSSPLRGSADPRFRGTMAKPTGNRWVVLSALAEFSRSVMTVVELVDKTELSPATVWRHLRALESDGLVSRDSEMAWDRVYQTFRGRQFIYRLTDRVPMEWWSR